MHVASFPIILPALPNFRTPSNHHQASHIVLKISIKIVIKIKLQQTSRFAPVSHTSGIFVYIEIRHRIIRILWRNKTNKRAPINIFEVLLKIYFKELVHAMSGLASPKSVGQLGRLETQARVNAAVLRQNFFSEKP